MNIVEFINENTNRETMESLSTKQVAQKLDLSVSETYKILKDAAQRKLITYLEPTDNNNFNCAEWIKN